MTTTVRFEADLHYNKISSWWKAQNWPVIPLSHLADIGIVSCVDEKPIAAGWLYRTDSAFCVFEWIVADPEVRGETRDLALGHLISSGKDLAKELGFQSIFMSVRNQSLIGRLTKAGFKVSDENMTNLIYNQGAV